MKPSEMRVELMGEHADLRAKIEETRGAAGRCQSGEDAREQLRGCLARLADAVRMHNQHEEEVMRAVVPWLDGWGPTRAALMLDAHVREHEDVYRSLMASSENCEAYVAAAAALKLIDQMLVHMAHEEKVFLDENVLNDDDAMPDSFGG